jgi:hypothetical protein
MYPIMRPKLKDVNKDADGNAPLIAREIAKKFVRKPEPKTPHKKSLWGA